MPETSIEWASHTWNPYTWNCTKVSQGCKNCYALERSRRYNGHASNGNDFLKFPPVVRENAWKELKKFDPGSVIFVNSHSDTYHEAVPIEVIQRIHQTAVDYPELIFLLLTKRVERAHDLYPDLVYPDNLWIGTSIENSETIWRLSILKAIPSAGRFVSAEPLLAPIYMDDYLNTGSIHWVIVGAESGANRRPFDKAWVRSIRDACVRFDVTFMFKQGSHHFSGKDRLLDGRTWDETPFTDNTEPVTEIPFQMRLF